MDGLFNNTLTHRFEAREARKRFVVLGFCVCSIL